MTNKTLSVFITCFALIFIYSMYRSNEKELGSEITVGQYHGVKRAVAAHPELKNYLLSLINDDNKITLRELNLFSEKVSRVSEKEKTKILKQLKNDILDNG